MKISELIMQLEAIQKDCGDILVQVMGVNEGTTGVADVEFIYPLYEDIYCTKTYSVVLESKYERSKH